MRGKIALLVVGLVGWNGPAHAWPKPESHAEFFCRSLDRFASGSVFGNPPNTLFELHFLPDPELVRRRVGFYTIEAVTKDRISGQLLGRPEVALGKIQYSRASGRSRFIMLTAPDFNQQTGRFTSFDLPGRIGDPFLMYGWSSVPKTVPSAIEYRCEVLGVT